MAGAILRVAEEQGAHVLAMDCRGGGALRHALIGSVTMGVVGGGCLPTLVTGPAVEPPPPQGVYHIVLTDDGSPSALNAVNSLAPMVSGSGAKVTLLNVYVPKIGDVGEAMERAVARSRLERTRALLPVTTAVAIEVVPVGEWARVAETIVRYAKDADASAVAMSTQGHGLARHVFAGSVALGVLGRSPTPLILTRCGR